MAVEAPTGPDLPRLPARPRVHGGRRGRGRARRAPDPADAAPADGDAIERAAELLRGAERPVIMAGTGLYWARGEEELRALAEELGIPVFLNGLARGCVPADHPQFFSRARGTGAEGRRRGAGGGRADGLPPGLRRLVRRRHPDRGGGLGAARAPAPARGGGGALRRRAGHARRAARGAAPAGPTASAWIEQLREVENEKRAAEQDDLNDDALAAPPDAPLPRAGAGARPRRRGDRRRRRLRVVRRPRDRQLRARLLDGPGPLRLPRHRTRLRARGQAGPPGPPGLPAARRRRLRLLGARVRHARAPRRAGGRR